ncbi:MAG: hypothetical protein AAF316_01990 [Cyanobacteria bacterium P01_A01_bin.80]
MSFIKIQNVVINTSYVAAVRLGEQTELGDKSVSILIASPKFPWEKDSGNFENYEWVEFTDQAAEALQDYFTSYNNVIDLLPKYEDSNVVSS